jgi:hypothetical protein
VRFRDQGPRAAAQRGRNAFSGGADSFADPLASASQADSYGIGLNCTSTRTVSGCSTSSTRPSSGGAATGDRKDEDSFQLRLAIAF